MMKRIFMLVLGIFFLLSGSIGAAPASPPSTEPYLYNMRTVIIAGTTQTGGPARYMARRLQAPFRLPYYEQKDIPEVLNADEINADNLRRIAQTYGADLVFVPVVRQWYWEEYHNFWLDDDMITEYQYSLTIYAYNRKLDTFKAYSTHGFDRDESSVLNQPQAVMSDAMDYLMEKLPYKRFPTDLDTQPASSATTTTEGHAKILTGFENSKAI